MTVHLSPTLEAEPGPPACGPSRRSSAPDPLPVPTVGEAADVCGLLDGPTGSRERLGRFDGVPDRGYIAAGLYGPLRVTLTACKDSGLPWSVHLVAAALTARTFDGRVGPFTVADMEGWTGLSTRTVKSALGVLQAGHGLAGVPTVYGPVRPGPGARYRAYVPARGRDTRQGFYERGYVDDALAGWSNEDFELVRWPGLPLVDGVKWRRVDRVCALPVSPRDRVVALHLLTGAGAGGRVALGTPTLSAATGLDRRDVSKALHALLGTGWLTLVERGGRYRDDGDRPSTYRIHY